MGSLVPSAGVCGQGEDLSVAKERRSEGFVAKS